MRSEKKLRKKIKIALSREPCEGIYLGFNIVAIRIGWQGYIHPGLVQQMEL